ncbi:MAG: acyl-ACP--UDP-N-acetylglucosamine O-acyltransferase [Gammaproteobacteria bacterium]|nr:acyl-ACP--UDP-N-acetylglucosamine O-acyltransferase [Gammaproteobacteria bacterium]
MIHPSAQIDPDARLGAGVSIGPWSIVGPGVEIGDGTEIGPHVVLRGPTRLGRENRVFAFCSIGEVPQDKKFHDDPDSRLEIGDGNTIREYCSINRGTSGGGGVTRVGSDNWIMAYCHVAHDCIIGDHAILANHSTLAGHVTLGDYCILGGFTGVHQFCRLGESAFTAISSIIVKDVPPFVMVEGNTARARAINREGLKRRGFETRTIEALKRAYRTLYRQGLTLNRALEELAEMVGETPELAKLIEFIRASERGIVRCRRD